MKAFIFGYESEHYDVSKKIPGLVLMPEINKTGKNTLVVANGFSCRHQIHDFAGRKAVHWVESVEFVQSNLSIYLYLSIHLHEISTSIKF